MSHVERCDHLDMQQTIAFSLVFLLAVVQCQRLFNVAPRFVPCNSTIWSQANVGGASCSGLSELLAVINSSIQTGDEVVINLERGSDHHYLTDVVYITANASITIRGMCRPGGNDCDRSSIMCDGDMANISDDYSVKFEHNYAVTLEGIEFIGCPRIIVLIEVFNVSITDCLFRLVVGVLCTLMSCPTPS